jgi:hypothetical protein
MRKNCRKCGTPFEVFGHYQFFCTPRCRDGFASNKNLGISPSTAGAIAELQVATDLMRRGFHVFRALSPSCECDLGILSNGSFQRVEVTTGRMAGQRLQYGHHDKRRYDIIAIVVGVEITYKPALPAFEQLAPEELGPPMRRQGHRGTKARQLNRQLRVLEKTQQSRA